MAKSTVTLPYTYTSDAQFRALGSALSGLFTTCGLTQTSDTGQANWTTITRMATLNTEAGYEMWRLNDTAHSTFPVFMRVSWATGGSTDRVTMTITLGSGSNGSGALTGATQGFFSIGQNNSNAGTIDIRMNYNATTGYFGISTGVVTGPIISQVCVGSLERLRTITGTPSTRGAAVVTFYNSVIQYKSWLTGGTWSSDTSNTIPGFWPWRSPGASSAGGTFISGLTPLTGDGTHGPLERTLGFCLCGSGDFVDGDQFTITRWDGSTHTYIATPCTGSAHMNNNGQESNARWAIWWE